MGRKKVSYKDRDIISMAKKDIAELQRICDSHTSMIGSCSFFGTVLFDGLNQYCMTEADLTDSTRHDTIIKTVWALHRFRETSVSLMMNLSILKQHIKQLHKYYFDLEGLTNTVNTNIRPKLTELHEQTIKLPEYLRPVWEQHHDAIKEKFPQSFVDSLMTFLGVKEDKVENPVEEVPSMSDDCFTPEEEATSVTSE